MQLTGLGMIPLSILLLEYLTCSTSAQIPEFVHNFLKNRLKNHTEALHYVKKMSFPVWTERCSHDKILQHKRNTESKESFLTTTLQYILFYLLCPPCFQSCGWCSSTERWRSKEGKRKICKSPWILCLKNPQNFCL